MVLASANSAQLNLADVRKTASRLQGRVALGQDPAVDKETAKREVENTFAVFADRFLEARKPSWRAGTYREAKRHLMWHAKPLHTFPIAAISQYNIAKLLEDVAKKSGGVTANRCSARRRLANLNFIGRIIGRKTSKQKKSPNLLRKSGQPPACTHRLAGSDRGYVSPAGRT
jgi:hypothetical protein